MHQMDIYIQNIHDCNGKRKQKNEYNSIVNTAIVLLGNGVILVSLINYSIIVFIKVWD